MDWRNAGVRVVRTGSLDAGTAQTPGMKRAEAIGKSTGSAGLWAGTVTIDPGALTGAHHHGEQGSVIYIVDGRARFRWGERLEFYADAGPGDFVFVPPWVPHQEINADPAIPLECVVVRDGTEPVVVNLEVEAVEDPSLIT